MKDIYTFITDRNKYICYTNDNAGVQMLCLRNYPIQRQVIFIASLLSDIHFMQIILFLTVAREESFSKAADLLHLTQSAVTKSISRLEGQLKLPLFARTTRSVRLTPEGEYLYHRWEPLLLAMEEDIAAARQLSSRHNTILKAGMTSTTNPELYFWPLADHFTAANPEIELLVESDSMEILRQKLASGAHDIAFLPHFERYSIREAGLCWRWAAMDHVFAYMPPEHPLAQKHALELSDFKNYGLVILDEAHNPNYIRDIQELFAPAGFMPRISRAMNNPYTIKASSRSLKDIIIVDAYFDFPPGTPLVRVPIRDHFNGIIYAWDPENTSRALQRFLDFLDTQINIPAAPAPVRRRVPDFSRPSP